MLLNLLKLLFKSLICCEKQVVDSNNKKTRFVTQAISELELSNVSVVQSRVENFHITELFDTITTRAYSTIADMVNQTSHLLAQGGIQKKLSNERFINNAPEKVVVLERKKEADTVAKIQTITTRLSSLK